MWISAAIWVISAPDETDVFFSKYENTDVSRVGTFVRSLQDSQTVFLVIGPPIGLFIAGFLLFWVMNGFQSSSGNSS
jgi:hypothetical protein